MKERRLVIWNRHRDDMKSTFRCFRASRMFGRIWSWRRIMSLTRLRAIASLSAACVFLVACASAGSSS